MSGLSARLDISLTCRLDCVWLYYEYGYVRIIDIAWNHGGDVHVRLSHDLVSITMRVGELVRNVQDDG